ncbi:helix-turn-helix domain-containing protein [Anaerobranca gottschalkii]|uniref:Helix-turn-helix n=1 Tax=Anaerobranca gottschalkii DSM 13577 TaxID=1120990 RepID=A0A1I0B1E8_9FIRM|nr:helix-turn-helix transcriptional regulator [Anaerobranca gottschalkii]SET00546.1 Helix-turn-helix [Anaerobranca gottschalkii DSM 13577]
MKRLRELRKEKKINQLKLAMDLNMTQASISKYEMGKREPSLEVLEKLSDYFGVSTDYLIGKSNIRKNIDLKSLNEDEINLILKYQKLTTKEKENVHNFIDFIVNNKNKNIDD